MAKARFAPVYINLLQLLKEARNEAGLRQAEVAKRLGRPQSFISKVESGERRIDVGEFVELAEMFGSDPARLLRKALRRR